MHHGSDERLPTVESRALSAFGELAGEFCRLIEGHRGQAPGAFLGAVQLLLPQLYAAGLALPDLRVLFPSESDVAEAAEHAAPDAGEVEPDPDRGDDEDWSALFTSLGTLLGERNHYREVFDPFEPETEAEVMGSLADDLADIYRDLRAGLRKWQRGESGEALWEWRFGFQTHWGEHLTGALRAIHVLASTYDLGWPSAGGAA
jgi:hypothetical protein